MLQTIWHMVIKNWKTTVTGLVIAIVWLTKELFGIELPAEVKDAITAILIFIFGAIAKDGNK